MNDLKATKGTMAFLSPSETLAIAAKAKALKAAGEDVCAMGAGEPDFDTPQHIKQAAVDALMRGETKYTPSSGIPALKKAIVEKFRNDNGIETEPSRVIVSPGAKFSGFAAICTLCGPGDEVIVPAPYWVSYTEMIKAAGATAVIVNCRAENNFELEPEALQAAITPRTKLLILNSPSNPTGAVYRTSTIEKIAEVALRNNIMVLSDEIYEKLIYDGNEHVCVSSLSKEIYEHTILINGFSKSHAMTGWRIGYAAASKDVIKGMTGFQSHVTSNNTTFVQWAAIRALQMGSDTVTAMRDELEKRRDFMYASLCEMPGITCVKPGGAFYLMPDISAYFGKKANGKIIKDAGDFCMYMLEEAKVAVVPGDAFFMPNAVRFSYTDSMDRLQEGMERFGNVLLKIE